MRKLTHHDLRQQSYSLALAVSLIVLAGTISLTLLWPAASLALEEQPPWNGVPAAPGAYQSPQGCRQCHTSEFKDWSSTTHAQAAFDPIFQVYLQQTEKPGECFACHTTGYNATTGQFVLAGVTCEACHGPYRPGHPEESMTIARSEKLCGTCHANTLQEWSSSRHGQVGVTCVDCHEVHTQRTRVAAATNALCAGCHENHTQDATHSVHSQAGVRCIDCHLARPGSQAQAAMKGHAVTGHSFTVAASTCDACHPIASTPAPPAP
jgi:hypothetical protein